MAWHRTSGNNGGKLEVLTASGDIASFETNLVAPYQSVLVNIEATGGNGTPDNPNPINGYTEANITRCGVNLWELSDDTKYDRQGCNSEYLNNGIKISANNTYARASYVYKVKVGQTYTLSYYGYGTGNFIQIYYNDQSVWNPQSYGRQQINSTRTKYTKTFTATSDVLFVGFYVTTTGTTGDMVIEDFMLEVGSSASDDFHPYTGNTYTIAFGQTVYGGVLDVTRGKLTVTHQILDMGSLNWYYASSQNAFYTTVVSGLKTKCNIKCSIYETNITPVGFLSDNQISTWNSYVDSGIITKDSRYSDAALYKTAMSGINAVYELATPIDIDLTPEVISAVVGTNNVFADCGETEVEYLKRE